MQYNREQPKDPYEGPGTYSITLYPISINLRDPNNIDEIRDNLIDHLMGNSFEISEVELEGA